ncbi:MAG: hypothetical protein JWQ18_796 [Conexibacter sp.]|nr:hypothetical protein [Conexibacter sp.]
MTAWLGFFGVLVAGVVALYTNAARLAQERELARLERLHAFLDDATQRLMEINVMENPYKGDLQRSLNDLGGKLRAGRDRLRLWFDEDHPVTKAWEECAAAISQVKNAWWRGQHDDEALNEHAGAVVERWSTVARAELRRQGEAVPSLWQVMRCHRPDRTSAQGRLQGEKPCKDDT